MNYPKTHDVKVRNCTEIVNDAENSRFVLLMEKNHFARRWN